MKVLHPLRAVLAFVVVIALAPQASLRAQEPTTEKKPADNPFTIEAEHPRLGVIDQGSTGTCWSFATSSFLETEVERLHKKKVDLSEIYFARMAILEKARRLVALQGHAQFGEGGLAHDLPYLIRQHGAVPQSVYSGLRNGDTRHNHAEMFKFLDVILKELSKEDAKPSAHWEDAIMGIVDAYIGTPPASFEYEGKQYTPRTFADEFLKLPVDDYIEVMSYGATPFHQPAELLVPDNWLRFQGYVNLPIDEMMEAIDSAVRGGYTVALDADVSEPGFRMDRGIAKLPKELEKEGAVTQEIRDAMFKKRETTDDHLMHVVGVAKHKDGGTYYLTKNSWGPKTGPFEGYVYISANYLRAKALSVMVHKDALKRKS